MVYHLGTVNDHFDQCNDACEISEEDLINMEGLPLFLIDDDEGSVSIFIENASEEVEEKTDGARFEIACEEVEEDLEGLEELEESDVDPEYDDKSDNDYEYPDLFNANNFILKRQKTANQIKENESSCSIKLSSANKIPIVVLAESDSDDSDAGSAFLSLFTTKTVCITIAK